MQGPRHAQLCSHPPDPTSPWNSATPHRDRHTLPLAESPAHAASCPLLRQSEGTEGWDRQTQDSVTDSFSGRGSQGSGVPGRVSHACVRLLHPSQVPWPDSPSAKTTRPPCPPRACGWRTPGRSAAVAGRPADGIARTVSLPSCQLLPEALGFQGPVRGPAGAHVPKGVWGSALREVCRDLRLSGGALDGLGRWKTRRPSSYLSEPASPPGAVGQGAPRVLGSMMTPSNSIPWKS